MSCKSAKAAGVLAAAAMMLGSVNNAHALSGKLGDWTISLSGFALAEWWATTNQSEAANFFAGAPTREVEAANANFENDVFVLILIALGGTRPLYHDLQFEWKLETRPQNGNFFGSGLGWWREANAGITGKFGSVKLGRFVTKAWGVLDWPYGQSGANEWLSENGAADWVTTGALRYTTPNIPIGNGGMAMEVTFSPGNIDADSYAFNIEAFLGLGISGFNLDVIYNRTEGGSYFNVNGGNGHIGQTGAGGGYDFEWGVLGPGKQGDVWQHMGFIGMRYAMPNGLQFHAIGRINQWHNKNGLTGLFASGGSGGRDPRITQGDNGQNATDLTSLQFGGTAAYGTGRWFFSGSYVHTLDSMIDGLDSSDELNDASGVFAGKAQYNIGDLVFLYLIVRHQEMYGDFHPAFSQPWQFHYVAPGQATGSTRFIVGTQALFF